MELPVKRQKRSTQKQFGISHESLFLGSHPVRCSRNHGTQQAPPRSRHTAASPPRQAQTRAGDLAHRRGPLTGGADAVTHQTHPDRQSGGPRIGNDFPNEVVLTAKQTGGSSLVVWEENGQSRMMDIFADLDVTSLRNALEQTYPGSNVEAQSQEGKVVLVGVAPSAATAEQMLKMATNFSKEVVNGLQIAQPPRLKQVMLKVRFAEADRGKLTAFGINLFSTGATNTVGTVSTQQFGPQSLNSQNQNSGGGLIERFTQFNISDLLNIFLFRPDINLGATIKALQQNQVLQILAEPNLMAISGQPAEFLAGGEFPYPVIQSCGGGGYGAVTIQFKPYGVKLEFVGTVQEDNSIRLKVKPEVSSLDYTNSVTISGFTMPAIQTRRAETEIELKNGQTFGIAGLLDERTVVQLSKIPWIGDVPILGELFKSRNVNRTNSELLVLVTPSIVDPITDRFRAAFAGRDAGAKPQ